MKLFYKIFKLEPDSREGVIMATSYLAVFVNLLCSLVKIVIGLAAASVAIVSEGINNATDALSSVLTIVGTKLAGKHPTRKHPFGFGRVEYLTSLVIAMMILFAGFEAIKESIGVIFKPVELELSYLMLVILAVSAVVKFLLGGFMIKQGKKIGSDSLIAVGKDCRADCLVSVVTIAATLIYLVFELSIDGYAGVITALFIIKAGFETLRDTLSDILGTAGDKELATKLYKIIRANPIVLNAADMMLHNYGPDAYSGSVNIEIDHSKTVEQVYAAIHAMQLEIMHEHNITMVFGIYAVDADRTLLKDMRRYIGGFVSSHEHVLSYHALYIDPNNNDIYCDLVVDYDLRDWAALESEFREYMEAAYPSQRLELVIETEFV